MTAGRPCLFLVVLMSCWMQAGMSCAEEQHDPDFLVIPLSKSADFTAALLRQIETVMGPIAPAKGKQAAVSSFVTKDGCYVLHGDLFGSGQRFVLMELMVESSLEKLTTEEKVVGLARLNEGKWELCALLDLAPVWRPKGWKKGDDGYLPVTPAERPFELEDLSGDGVPEVVLAAGVAKYYQQHFLFRWNAKTKGLTYVEDSMARPAAKGGYVILHFNSGRRAIWGEWRFCQWEGDRLMERASWHDEVPYNEPEESFMLATRTDSQGAEAEYKVEAKESDADTDSVYQITHQDKPFARVTFKWSRSLVGVTSEGYDPSSEESAYLFEKLTGLPRKLYPANEWEKHFKVLEKNVKIHVEGEPAAVKLLSAR